MLKRVKQRLDKIAIHLATSTLPPGKARPSQIEEATAILASPGFPKLPGAAAQVQFTTGNEFTFDSAVPLPWAANNRVHGKLFRTGGEWRERPLVLLVHGWNAELQYLYELPLIARALARRGVNGAILQLPFHGPRRPREPGAVRNFISDDIPVMLRATEQALADLESFLLWAKSTGCPAAGTWGFSLGGWLAGLLLCRSDVQDIGVLTTPVSNLEEVIGALPFCEPIRRALGGVKLDLSPLNLTSHQPRIPPEKILITQSEYDLFVSRSSLARLEEAWGHPRFWRVPHSHISVLLAWQVLRRTVFWCVEELKTRPV